MREFKNKNFHRAIQIAEKSEHAQSMSHQAFEEQIFNLVNVKGSKRGGNFDAQSEAQTIYNQPIDDNYEGKSMKSKKSLKQKQQK